MQKENSDTNDMQELFDEFEMIVVQLNNMKSHITNLQQNIKNLEKNIKRKMKSMKREVTKTKNKGNKNPTGFAHPSAVSKELCDFMNKTEGTQIARTEVTRALVSYIKENKLENELDSRIIMPDEKLKILLGIEDGQVLNYFNIQKYMNKHFVKSAET
jgi:chromatin remodeling complex protein RSC6